MKKIGVRYWSVQIELSTKPKTMDEISGLLWSVDVVSDSIDIPILLHIISQNQQGVDEEE